MRDEVLQWRLLEYSQSSRIRTDILEAIAGRARIFGAGKSKPYIMQFDRLNIPPDI